MKTNLLFTAGLSIILLTNATNSNSQSTSADAAAVGIGHIYTAVPLSYVGYTNPGNLDFQTQGVVNMMIDGTTGTGFVGVGNVAFPPFIPQSLMHLHLNGANANLFQQFTNGNTGNGNNISGYRTGIEYNLIRNATDATYRNYSPDSRFYFSSTNQVNMHQTRLMMQDYIIPGWANEPVNRVKIIEEESNINTIYANQPPLALLHLGHHWPVNAGGHRNWMDIGTYSHAWSDCMYVGMKNVDYQNFTHPWSSHMNAVIAWGDNITDSEGPDDMSVIFSGIQTVANGDAGTVNGMEVMRFTPWARVGIGNFTDPANGLGSGIRPWRRLEIYDEHVENQTIPGATLQFTPAPQLRLTFTPDANVGLGTWTDFQTNITPALGSNVASLYIHPSSDILNAGTPINGNVGINTPNPQRTLEIETNDSPTSPVTGNSGLRLHDLTTASQVTLPNPWPPTYRSVLTVDANGDVILVHDDGGGTVTNGCTNVNYLPKVDPSLTNFVCSQVFDNFNTVSIGTYANLFYKFEVAGQSVFSLTGNPNPLPYATLNSFTQFPLAVITSTEIPSNLLRGIGVFSQEVAARDRLNIYSDQNGLTHFESIKNNTVFYDRILRTSTIGLIPNLHTTVIKDDFKTNQTTMPNTTLYVEAQTWNGEVKNSAIIGNNMVDDNLINLSGWEMTGVKGLSTFLRTRANVSNAGGYFQASSATLVNTGAHIISIGDQNRSVINYGARIWTGAAPEGISAVGTGVWNYGTFSRVFYQGALGNFGGYFKAEDGHSNYGVWGEAVNNLATNNFGGHFGAANAGTINYGIYATAPVGACGFVAPPACVQAAGYFLGDVYCSTGGYFMPSDSKLKHNITPLQLNDPLGNNLKAYSYNYSTENFPSMGLPQGTHYGFIAEEVEAVFPNLVKWLKQPAEYDADGKVIQPETTFKGVNQMEFIALLWNRSQNLQHQMDSIKQIMASCCNAHIVNPNTGLNEFPVKQTINLVSSEPILYQNQPNPFDRSTTIRYFIPENAVQPKIIFQDETGRTINETDLTETGQNAITVNADLLKGGIYTYSLQIAGKIYDSKKMVLTK